MNTADVPCTAPICFLCEFEHNVNFVMRGLCEGTSMEENYYLILESSFNSQPVFKGYKKGYIVFDSRSDSWVIIDMEILPENETINESNVIGRTLEFPVGIKQWSISDRNCNETQSTSLKFSMVSFLELTKIFENELYK